MLWMNWTESRHWRIHVSPTLVTVRRLRTQQWSWQPPAPPPNPPTWWQPWQPREEDWWLTSWPRVWFITIQTNMILEHNNYQWTWTRIIQGVKNVLMTSQQINVFCAPCRNLHLPKRLNTTYFKYKYCNLMVTGNKVLINLVNGYGYLMLFLITIYAMQPRLDII